MMNIKFKYIINCKLLLFHVAFPFSCNAQLGACNLVIPPFVVSGIEVTHVLVQNSIVTFDTYSWPICSDSNLIIPDSTPIVSLGSGPDLWNPFEYILNFSNPIQSIDFVIYVSGTGDMNIDYGAENFVFETSQANLNIQTVFACNEFIDGDTLFLGYNTLEYGDGIFTIVFDCPITSFKISGKGGGAGSRLNICSNSITTPYLSGRVSGDTLVSAQDSVLFEAFGGVAPFTFSYTLNGGSVQTLQSNTPQVWLSTPTTNGVYTYELLQVKDGLDSIATIACQNTHVVEVDATLSAQLIEMPEKTTLSLILYPNPSSGQLYIKCNDQDVHAGECVIRGLDGREIYSGVFDFEKGLSLNNLSMAKGVYIIEITTKNEIFHKQFVYYR
jgi:hypothetical protein